MNRALQHIRPLLIGVALAGLTYGVAGVLPGEVRLPLHAVLLAGIAAVYVGFALSVGRPRFLVLQITGALAFGAAAVAGLTVHPNILAAGYGLHGVWDLLHHRSEIPGRQVPWYIPLCLAYDWGVAGYLLLLY